MKGTQTYNIAEGLCRLEINLLRRAVTALGGEYEFPEDKQPTVAVNVYNDPFDIDISKIIVGDFGVTCIGYDYEAGEDIEFDPADIYPGHINFIIDNLPDVDGFDGAFATKAELEEIIKRV